MLEDGGPPGYRQGLLRTVESLVKPGESFSHGDLVAQDGNFIQSWSQMDAQAGPTRFFDVFLGVYEFPAGGAEAAGTPARVIVSGQCRFPLAAPAAAYVPVGVFVTAKGNQLVEVDPTMTEAEAIGRVCRPVKVGDREVLFELRSRIMQ